ncbi:MAG: hypothetical protein AMS19_14700 [Gemmatimonas sp. SG8_23]|nr:MAG: hypothetical protein AMS19_14700 [Gemmatimonas sp. SG8_23]
MSDTGELGGRAISVLGFCVMIGIAWLASSDRSRIPWRTVGWGVGLQLALGVLLLETPFGALFFRAMNGVVAQLTRYTDVGVDFVFGALVETGFSFVVNVLPIIVVMGSLFAVLYHLGLLQRVVDAMAALLSRTMRTSGAESLAAVANLFVGMTESALIVRPYLDRMTRSELFALMTLGMSTIAKVMVPETETPETAAGGHAHVERTSVNVIDAAAQGAVAGLRLAAYVGAMLLAFVALIALVNDVLAAAGGWVGLPGLTLQKLLGLVLAPIAWLLGVPWQDAATVGALLGVKTVLNEFLAYQELSELMAEGALAPRSVLIASYALCGFANFGSLAILLGGLGGLAPGRRSDVARFGLRSILSGTLASFMTACVAGLLG